MNHMKTYIQKTLSRMSVSSQFTDVSQMIMIVKTQYQLNRCTLKQILFRLLETLLLMGQLNNKMIVLNNLSGLKYEQAYCQKINKA